MMNVRELIKRLQECDPTADVTGVVEVTEVTTVKRLENAKWTRTRVVHVHAAQQFGYTMRDTSE
jgi:hypothetical protein